MNAGPQNKNKSKNSLVRECALPYVLVKFEKVELRKFSFSTISELQSNFPIGYVVCTRIEELTRKKGFGAIEFLLSVTCNGQRLKSEREKP